MFAFRVEDRKIKTLYPLIRKHIAPKTTIIHDDWPAYRSIGKKLGNPLGYKHYTICHKKTFARYLYFPCFKFFNFPELLSLKDYLCACIRTKMKDRGLIWSIKLSEFTEPRILSWHHTLQKRYFVKIVEQRIGIFWVNSSSVFVKCIISCILCLHLLSWFK